MSCCPLASHVLARLAPPERRWAPRSQARHIGLGGLLATDLRSPRDRQHQALLQRVATHVRRSGDAAASLLTDHIWDGFAGMPGGTANWDSNTVLVHPAKFYSGIQAFAYAEIRFSARTFVNFVGWVEFFTRPNAFSPIRKLLGLAKSSTQPTASSTTSSPPDARVKPGQVRSSPGMTT
jgi:hypothetical protein